MNAARLLWNQGDDLRVRARSRSKTHWYATAVIIIVDIYICRWGESKCKCGCLLSVCVIVARLFACLYARMHVCDVCLFACLVIIVLCVLSTN